MLNLVWGRGMKRFRACVVLGMLVSGALVPNAGTVHYNYIGRGHGGYRALRARLPTGSRGVSLKVAQQTIVGVIPVRAGEQHAPLFLAYNRRAGLLAGDGGRVGP